jgi:hypothetical protein
MRGRKIAPNAERGCSNSSVIFVLALKKATWANFEIRSMARNMWSLPPTRRSSQTSMWTYADRRLGEALALRSPRHALVAVGSQDQVARWSAPPACHGASNDGMPFSHRRRVGLSAAHSILRLMRLSPRNNCAFNIKRLEHLILHVRLEGVRFGFVAFGRSDHTGALLMQAEAGRDLAAQPYLFAECA